MELIYIRIKISDKDCFLSVPYTSALAQMSILKKFPLSYTITMVYKMVYKKDYCFFSVLSLLLRTKKAFILNFIFQKTSIGTRKK